MISRSALTDSLARLGMWLAGITFLGSALLVAPSAALADPGYAHPDYARPDTEEVLRGRIRDIHDPYHLALHDRNGDIDEIQLHHGTIITPRGLTLEPGMRVTIRGYDAGEFFEANEIDTPYRYDASAPPPVYYGAGWWYPGYAYGYGPAYSLSIGYDTQVIRRPFFHEHPWAVSAPAPHAWHGEMHGFSRHDGDRRAFGWSGHEDGHRR